ncbi:MAG TPA: membrane dipeptidase [Acidimicrobiales bacterium]
MTSSNSDGAAEPYVSYGYLEAGEDIPVFDLSPEFARVPPYEASLTAEEAVKARQVLEDNIVISLHDHPVRYPSDMYETPAYNLTGRHHTGFAGLKASGMTVVFDNMMDGTACVTGHAPWRWSDIITDLGMRQADIAHQDDLVVIRTIADIEQAHASHKVGLVFGLEASTPIENEIERLDVLYGVGLRQIGIAYSDSNALGSGANEIIDGGLTHFGRRAVRRMNQLGLAIDISHSSFQTGVDTCRASTQPVFMTHVGAKGVWDKPSMKSDDALRAVADTGGVIGISAAPHATLSRAHPRHSILSVMDHFQYCVDLVGIEHVAFGPDTLYGDHVELHNVFAKMLFSAAKPGPAFEKVPYVDGLENPTENFENISGWLVQHKYSEADMTAVLGGNILRALRSIWA